MKGGPGQAADAHTAEVCKSLEYPVTTLMRLAGLNFSSRKLGGEGVIIGREMQKLHAHLTKTLVHNSIVTY